MLAGEAFVKKIFGRVPATADLSDLYQLLNDLFALENVENKFV